MWKSNSGNSVEDLNPNTRMIVFEGVAIKECGVSDKDIKYTCPLCGEQATVYHHSEMDSYDIQCGKCGIRSVVEEDRVSKVLAAFELL